MDINDNQGVHRLGLQLVYLAINEIWKHSALKKQKLYIQLKDKVFAETCAPLRRSIIRSRIC